MVEEGAESNGAMKDRASRIQFIYFDGGVGKVNVVNWWLVYLMVVVILFRKVQDINN